MSEENLQIAVINVIRIFRHTGINKAFQCLLQTQTVDIHLHVIRNLMRLQAGALQHTGFRFFFLNSGIKFQILASFMNKAKGCRLQIGVFQSTAEQVRLTRTDISSELLPVFFSHFFQCCICHKTASYAL